MQARSLAGKMHKLVLINFVLDNGVEAIYSLCLDMWRAVL